MTGVIVFALLILVLAGLFAVGWWIGSRRQTVALLGASVGLALLLVKSLLTHLPSWEAALFPWTGYAYVQGMWLWLLAQFFFGLAIPQLTVRWNRWVVGAVAVVLCGQGMWAQRWLIIPFRDGVEAGADAAHHRPQSTTHTCVPASCVMVLSYWGIAATEAEMVRLCLTREEGTTSFNAYRGLALKTAGLPFRCRIVRRTIDELPGDGTPVLWTDGAHARVLLRLGDRFLVHDPLQKGPAWWDREQVVDLLDGPVVLLSATDGRRPMPIGEPPARNR